MRHRQCTFCPSDELANYLQRHGGNDNAFTTQTHTNYYFYVNSPYFAHGLEIFSSCFKSPLFDKAVSTKSPLLDKAVSRAFKHGKHLTNSSHLHIAFVLSFLRNLNTFYNKESLVTISTIYSPPIPSLSGLVKPMVFWGGTTVTPLYTGARRRKAGYSKWIGKGHSSAHLEEVQLVEGYCGPCSSFSKVSGRFRQK